MVLGSESLEAQHQRNIALLVQDFSTVPEDELRSYYLTRKRSVETDARLLDHVPALVYGAVRGHYIRQQERTIQSYSS